MPLLVSAIIEAALLVVNDTSERAIPEIMISLVAAASELQLLHAVVERAVREVLLTAVQPIEVTLCTMVELPRATLTPNKMAELADFMSLGTNDFPQTTFSLSRDDAGSFLPGYIASGLLPTGPFITLDRDGVGVLVEIVVAKGRARRPRFKLGICDERGGDPATIALCEEADLDYVSSSFYRLPIAQLAAMQVALTRGALRPE